MVNLQRGDCLELMKNIPEKSVDMILCDLPYGTTRNKWDKVINISKIFELYEQLIKSGGAIALFAQPPFNAKLIAANEKQFRYEWIWEKSISTGFLNSHKMPLKSHENILIFYDKLPVYNPQFAKGKPYTKKNGIDTSSNYGKQSAYVTVNDGVRYPTDILKFNCEKGLQQTEESKSVLRQYQADNDHVQQFLDERLDLGETYGKIRLTEVQRDYNEWCRDVNIRPLGKKAFTEELTKHRVSIKTSHKQNVISARLRDNRTVNLY